MSTAPAPAESLRLLTDAAAYHAYLQRHGPPDREHFETLAEALVQAARVAPAPLAPWADALIARARESGEAVHVALAERARGNVDFLCGEYAQAVEHYRAALNEFGESETVERGRTLSSLLHPLALLGDVAGGLEAAAQARACFERAGDDYRLARLDINLASVLFREDKFPETLAALERAQAGLEGCAEAEGDHEAWAAIRVTRAVVLINLARFEEAEQAYEEARAYARAHALPHLATQAEYNIGYLYFLRGQYVHAIRALDRARATAISAGDKLHRALCDLDQADVCIELNLYEDALQLAYAARAQFEAQGMPYEQGKAFSNMAVAERFLGHDSAALELLAQAAKAFAAAGNEFWVHMTALYRGVVLLQMGRCFEALQLSEQAWQFFEQRQLRTKAVYAGILMARARAAAQDPAGALQAIERALQALSGLQAPWLRSQAQVLVAQLAQARGDRGAALAAYEEAMESLEAIQGVINFDELRISFLRHKQQMYENYAALLMAEAAPDAARVWEHIERAKAHMLAPLMAGAVNAPQPHGEGSRLVHDINRLREELSWYYRQLQTDLPGGPVARGTDAVLMAIQQREQQLLRAIRQLPGDEYRLLMPAASVSHERLAPLLTSASLIEYFPCGDGYLAVVADSSHIQVCRLPAPRGEIEAALRLMRFQVGKRAMEGDVYQRHGAAFLHTAEAHLRLLHRALLRPLEPWLRHEQWVIIPHGMLRALPFAALRDDNGWVLDRHRLVLAPSAALLAVCSQRRPSPHTGTLLVSTDAAAAQEEIRSLKRCRHAITHLVAQQAHLETLRSQAAEAGVIHIAARGDTGPQRPDWAALELADGRLNVIDILHLRLQADLAVLTGRATALGDPNRADEHIGLTRAFLFAGARHAIATLWDVDDHTTAEFIESFYSHWARLPSASQALHAAQRELRQRYSHPYYWAPFQLQGSLSG